MTATIFPSFLDPYAPDTPDFDTTEELSSYPRPQTEDNPGPGPLLPPSVPLLEGLPIPKLRGRNVPRDAQVSVGDARFVNFVTTFSEVLSEVIGRENVSAACSAMFLDLPEQFRKCFERAPEKVQTKKRSPEKIRLRQLKAERESLYVSGPGPRSQHVSEPDLDELMDFRHPPPELGAPSSLFRDEELFNSDLDDWD
jgi:hypothetical protein